MKTIFLKQLENRPMCVVVRSCAQFCVVFSRRRWRHLYDNFSVKIASKNRTCVEMRNYLCFFVVKKQRTNTKSGRINVADR